MEDIIIWGAGKASLKRYEWALFAGYRIVLFIDNNPDLWGKKLNNILITSPEALKAYNCPILTSDAHFDEISAQLDKMGYTGDRISFRQFRKEAVCRKDVRIDLCNVKIGDNVSFVFDSYFSEMNWGGTEEWSCMVANAIAGLGVQTYMICGMNDKFDSFTNNCMHFAKEDEISMIKKMAQKIAECLPCVFVSYSSIALYAARIVKTIFPDKITLITVAHGDNSYFYPQLKLWSDRIDKIVCISKKIYTVFQEQYGLTDDILIYKPNPIRLPKGFGKRTFNDNILQIGFAARLEKMLKRTHLLPEIIDACMFKKLDIRFNIAGEGQCLDFLKNYVSRNHLEDRVHILGWISPTDMAGFWAKQDIYLNVSESEGMSLSMLEAMA